MLEKLESVAKLGYLLLLALLQFSPASVGKTLYFFSQTLITCARNAQLRVYIIISFT